MPWCPRCATGLSEHEIAGEGYEERVHTSVFVRFPLVDRPGESLLVWTTTPWTLSSNVAAAVHPDLTYQLRPGRASTGCGWPRAPWPTPSAAQHDGAGGAARASELLGWRYRGPFDELPAAARRACSTGSSPGRTWARPRAPASCTSPPAAARKTSQLGKEHGLAVIAPIDEFGVFVDGFGLAHRPGRGRGGRRASSQDLEQKGMLYQAAEVPHRYPHLLALQERAGLPPGRRVVHLHGRAALRDHGRHQADPLDPRLRPGARAGLAAATWTTG